MFVILPLAFYTFLALIKRLLSVESWKSAFTQLVLALLPITASMHVLKALLKTTSRIPYWDFAILDPKGIQTADLIFKDPNVLKFDFMAFVISPTISILAILMPMLGLILSFFVIQKQVHANRSSQVVTIAAVLIYFSLFLLSLIAWRIL